jgi:hypothetical protein
MPGVFISKGMSLRIPSISFTIRDDGEIEGAPVVLEVHFDVCPTWIQLAKKHLSAARRARKARDSAWTVTDEDKKSKALEAEFEASMQAMMAAAIAWDSAYANLKEFVDLPQSIVDQWRKGRTARYSQVSEVVRRAFTLKPKGVKNLRSNLKEIYRFRDLAVHPSGKIQPAQHHPELDVGVEWRFAYFRASNAEVAVIAAAAMLWDLAHNGKPKNERVAEYQGRLASRLQEIFPRGAPKLPTGGKTE